MATELNGLSVGIVTVGGLLIYAGIQGKSPLQALRDVSSGNPPSVKNTPGVAGGNVALGVQGSSVGASALSAASSFGQDQYSQLKRTEPGFSDCSSFVAKAFHAVGVAKPDGRMEWPNTTAFANGPAWKTIPQAEAKPGDIAVTSGRHMTFVTNAGGTEGLGQQRPGRNVQTDTIANLFKGAGTPIFRTYVGAT